MLLAGTTYDPATAAQFATTAAGAMAALDTTNLRLSFTVPSNGKVAVKLRGATRGATTSPAIHLGILQSTTVIARHAGPIQRTNANANSFGPVEAAFVVNGLTPGASLTWDAACGIETAVAASAIQWGGPNNTTANDARGGFCFEIWEASNCLAAKAYDPASAVTTAVTTAALAMTALDTTNLRVSFTTPASGPGSAFVLVRTRAVVHGAAALVAGLLGVMDGATVKARFPCTGHSSIGALAATDFQPWDASGLIAVSPLTTYNWDLAYGVETLQAATALKYGGPDDATVDNAFGAAVLEVWKA